MSNDQVNDKKIDIFEMMENVDKKNRNYYNELTDEQKKAFMPYLAPQSFNKPIPCRYVS